MRKRSRWVSGFIVLISVLILSYIVISQKSQIKQECIDKGKVCVSYSTEWKKENLQNTGLEKYVHLRLRQEDPKGEFQITSQVGKVDIKDEAFRKDVVDKLQLELTDFKLVSSELIKVNNIDAAELIYGYKYKNNSGEDVRNKQRLIIWPAPDKVYYITMQASPTDFTTLSQASDDIISSLEQRSN